MQVSLDIESLSTQLDAVILSIAAVPFSTKKLEVYAEDAYSVQLDINSQIGRHVCSDTLAWWDKQNKDVRHEAMSGKTVITDALQGLYDWSEKNKLLDSKWWAKGVDFDMGIIKDACSDYKVPVAWKYYNKMELRTLAYLASRRVGINTYPKPSKDKAHTALGDAIHQANEIIYYHNHFLNRE